MYEPILLYLDFFMYIVILNLEKKSDIKAWNNGLLTHLCGLDFHSV
jgi:hypothetical protein